LVGLLSVRCFFAHSDLSQATVVCAQNKFQSVFFEVFSKLISTFSAFVHLDSESSKVPFFIGYLHVCCAVRTFRQNFPPSRAIGRIPNIYNFPDTSPVNFTCYLLSMRYRFTLPAPLHFGHRFLEFPVPIVPSPWHSGHVTSQSSSRS
jgi:hypothetical protein